MSGATYTVPDGCPDIVTLATSLWGKSTSKKDGGEVRFGSNGSKCVLPHPANTWHDHESNVGGGYGDLFKLKYGKTPGASEIETTYNYTDERGELLFQVVRKIPKKFVQRRPDPSQSGKWIWKLKGVRQVPYRLPDIIGAPPDAIVYVVEGEKDCDNLARLGLVATCNAGGANKWRADFAQHFADRHVVILPDNDMPGGEHADDVAAKLFNVVASVRIVQLPDLPPKGDVSDWLAAGGTAEALAALVEATEPLLVSPAGFNPRARDREAKPERERPREAGRDTEPSPAWHQFYLLDDKGNPIANLSNALTAMRSAEEAKGIIAYDEMAQCPVIRWTPPGSKHRKIEKPRPVTDADVGCLQEWLQRNELRKIGKETTHQAVGMIAHEHTYHPVRSYLQSLQWDGTPRLDKWLSYYIGAEPSPDLPPAEADGQRQYLSAIGRMFMVALVQRIFEPGCKADYMLVFEGTQGDAKSTVPAILAGEWFADGLPDIRNSDAVRLSMHLRGHWLIEIAELSAMSKSAVEDVKSFITQRVEEYTPKYGRLPVKEPRQCLFIGTTNQSRYLKDETGNRRFWPVKVGRIDTDALTADRDQLFAEAMVAYRRGDRSWPDRDFETRFILPQQEDRFEEDAWQQPIEDWIAEYKITSTTIKDIGWGALNLDVSKIHTTEQRRISAVLTRLGWSFKRSHGVRRWTQGART